MGAARPAVIPLQGSNEPAGPIAELIERVRQRDSAALRSLYVAYSRRVHSYALQVLRDEHAAEDVVHDVFMRVWRYAGSYDAAKAAKPEAWLFQIARNVALDEAVHRSRMVQAKEEDTFGDTLPGETSSVDLAASLAESADARGPAFGRALQELPSPCRQVLHLRFHQGMSNPEIARHLGVPLGTAKTWMRRGLLQMRESLKVAAPLERQQEEWA
jgi:RNA polymerase sigma-70 factor (ECF subfamily)